VQAIELALTAGKPGEAYFILDEGNRSLREMISAMAAAAGVTLGDKSIPAWLAAAVGTGSEWLWRTFSLKGEPPLTRHAAMVMSRECTLVGAKAKADLGYVPAVTVGQGLQLLGESLAK